MFELNTLVRENVKKMTAYKSARSEYYGNGILLDANENPFGKGINRYPDPLQREIKEQLAIDKKILAENIFLGNGSDEAIDLILRIFCTPKIDSIIICPPTYGMYKVLADINDIICTTIALKNNFQLDVENILMQTQAKILFLCSPNNPTGNSLSSEDLTKILENFKGIIVLDEAYIDFSDSSSYVEKLNLYPNLIILQTFSKAWGLAGARVGMALASVNIIQLLNKIKMPYNVNVLSQKYVLKILKNKELIRKRINLLKNERSLLLKKLKDLNYFTDVYESDANFILLKTNEADNLYAFLLKQKILIRNNVSQLKNYLRISIGNSTENKKLFKFIENYSLGKI